MMSPMWPDTETSVIRNFPQEDQRNENGKKLYEIKKMEEIRKKTQKNKKQNEDENAN